MRGAESSGRRVGRRALLGLATLSVAGALSVVCSTGSPASVRAGLAATDAVIPPATTNSSYGIVDAAGGVMTFGGAEYSGDTIGYSLAEPIVGAAANPYGGYWLVASDGGIFAYGDAGFFGSTGAIHLNAPIVGMTATPDGTGYWFTASDGGVFNYGSAGFFGSLGGSGVNDVAGMSLGI